MQRTKGLVLRLSGEIVESLNEVQAKLTVSHERIYDDHGQPPRYYYRQRVEGRQIAEMLGMARGILADGVVSEMELVALLNWFREHPDVTYAFPGDVVAKRLIDAFADGYIDDDERADLASLLQQLVGDDGEEGGQLDHPTKLAFDDPLPTLMFEGWEYVVTGKFAYGPRSKVEKAITDRGGRLAKGIGQNTDVLVVGTFSSNAWLESTHGTKILNALERRTAGYAIRVVPEAHWYKTIQYDE